MKWYQILGLVVLGLVVFIASLSFVSGGEYILIGLKKLGLWFWGFGKTTVLLTVIFVLTGFLGWFFRIGISHLDENVDRMKDLGTWAHIAIAFVFSLPLGGVVEILVVPWIVTAPWARGVYGFMLFFKNLATGADRIAYETPPLAWFVYGVVVFWIGYMVEEISEFFSY